jgi:hypothetical protein
MELLGLEGGGMNPAPAWSLSVAELEAIGLSQRAAQLATGMSPGFALDGQWVILIDDQPYKSERARIIQISGDSATCNSGAIGTVDRLPRKALIRFPAADDVHDDECIVISAAQASDFAIGTVYHGRNLPQGDPGELFRELEEAEENDRGGDELPAADCAWLYRLETIEERFSDERARVSASLEDFGKW